MSEANPYPQLTALVKEIRQGRRVVFMPPGIVAFVGAVMLIMVAFGTSLASVQKFLSAHLDTPQLAILQVGSAVLIVPALVFPAIMLTRGHKNFSLWLKLVSFTIVLIALIIAGTLFLQRSITLGQFPIPLVSATASIVAIIVMHSASFKLFCEFFYLLKRSPP